MCSQLISLPLHAHECHTHVLYLCSPTNNGILMPNSFLPLWLDIEDRRKISLSSLSQCALWISVPLLSCSFAITRLFNAPSNVAVRQPAMTYSKTLAYRFWSCSWSRLTFTPILSMCFTTSQNSGNILSHLVFVPEKWSDIKSPITMSVSMHGFSWFPAFLGAAG